MKGGSGGLSKTFPVSGGAIAFPASGGGGAGGGGGGFKSQGNSGGHKQINKASGGAFAKPAARGDSSAKSTAFKPSVAPGSFKVTSKVQEQKANSLFPGVGQPVGGGPAPGAGAGAGAGFPKQKGHSKSPPPGTKKAVGLNPQLQNKVFANSGGAGGGGAAAAAFKPLVSKPGAKSANEPKIEEVKTTHPPPPPPLPPVPAASSGAGGIFANKTGGASIDRKSVV